MTPKTVTLTSFALDGATAFPVTVTVTLIERGTPSVSIVGLGDAPGRRAESMDRVRSAIQASGYQFPSARIEVTLDPASKDKASAPLDLALAVGILVVSGQVAPDAVGLATSAYVGELALSGVLRPVRGGIAFGAAMGGIHNTLVAPLETAALATATALRVRGVVTLRDAVTGVGHPIPAFLPSVAPVWSLSDCTLYPEVLEALTQAAQTREPVVLVGPPGSRALQIGARLATLLPALTPAQAITVAQNFDAAGFSAPTDPRQTRRPFRAPHHTISVSGMLGNFATGGRQWGEVQLAQYGVLLLDDVDSFKGIVLDNVAVAVTLMEEAPPWLVGTATPDATMSRVLRGPFKTARVITL